MPALETKYNLTDEKVAEFQQNGFVKLEKVFDAEEIAALRDLTDEVIQPDIDQRNQAGAEGYSAVFLQKVNMWQNDERFKMYTLSPRLADIAARLMSEETVRIWHDHLMVKLPEKTSKPTDWHQDFPYWPMNYDGSKAMSIWIAMQETTPDMGCMSFVPGSHAWGAHEVVQLGTEQKEDYFDHLPAAKGKKVEKVCVPLGAGDVTFHYGLTYHYAASNRTDRRRRALSIIYMPDGTTYNGNPHVITDAEDGLGVGAALDGPLHPALGRLD